MECLVLVLSLYSYCGDKKIKDGLLSNHLIQRVIEHGGWRELKVSINFYKKQCLPHIKSNKKHLSKQAVTITYTLEKKFPTVATFEGFVSSFFSDRVKTLVVYLVCLNLVWVSRKDKTKWNCFSWLIWCAKMLIYH